MAWAAITNRRKNGRFIKCCLTYRLAGRCSNWVPGIPCGFSQELGYRTGSYQPGHWQKKLRTQRPPSRISGKVLIGRESKRAVPFKCNDRNVQKIPQVSVDELVAREKIPCLDILHADIQGSELEMLQGATSCIENKRIGFVFISTHHHAISGDPLIHQRCREFLLDHGGTILADHIVSESYSGDGLLVAALHPRHTCPDTISMSYNRAENSLFGDPMVDIAELQQLVTELQTNIARLENRPIAGGNKRLVDLRSILAKLGLVDKEAA